MAFFKALAAIGIGRDELADVSNDSLIRIEKKLIAEQKLNNTISKNDVEKAVRILKDYPDVLKEIARYDCFFGILMGYDTEWVDTLARYDAQQRERIKLVVSDYFTDELTDYINANLSQNNWNNIRVLLHYRVFFNNDIIKTLTGRLEAKMEYAMAIMQQGIGHAELEKNIGYIADKEFYFTLGEVDKRHFLKFIVRMIDLIKQNPGYASQSRFFSGAKQAMWWYDTTNIALAGKLGMQVTRQTTTTTTVSRRTMSSARIFYYILITSIALYNLTRSCNTTTTTPNTITYKAPKSIWSAGERTDETGELDSVRSDQRLKMEDFVEARRYPVTYPADSLKAHSITIKKYGNPFNLDIFSGSYNYVKNGVPRIAIVNNTDKECVAISYFRQRFDTGLKVYAPIDNINSIDIYAFYIPPHDSINVDLKMDLLRFYMGEKLAAFNTYREHIYPDSLDAKFSKFTRADSMLFSKAFVPSAGNTRTNKNTALKKVSVLTISQPTPDSYLLGWTGKTPLFKHGSWLDEVSGKRADSISSTRPLLLDLKAPSSTDAGNPTSSFIYN